MNLQCVEVFKTNVLLSQQASAVLNILSARFPAYRINFDLDDCDNILRVEGKDVAPDSIIAALISTGFECEVLQ